MVRKNNVIKTIDFFLQEGLKLGDSVKLKSGMHKGKKGKVESLVDHGEGKSFRKGKWVEVRVEGGWKATLPLADVVKEK